jgi:hypothetical protein
MAQSTFFSRYLKRAREFIQEDLDDWDEELALEDLLDEPKKKKKMVYRNREEAHANLYRDYLSENPRYDEETFQRRFRMPSNMFKDICTRLVQHDKYWEQRPVRLI